MTSYILLLKAGPLIRIKSIFAYTSVLLSITGQPSQAVKQVDSHQTQLEIVVGPLRINMELIIVQGVHYSYGTLACMVHVLK